MMNIKSFENIINDAWNNKSQINSKSSKKILNAIAKTIDLLDSGKIRVAENKNNEWIPVKVNSEKIVCNVGDMLERLTNDKLKYYMKVYRQLELLFVRCLIRQQRLQRLL